jgi:hypothetical protein
MFFVKAMNDLAETALLHFDFATPGYEKPEQPLHGGYWFSEYEFSRLSYKLRRMTFSPNSKINKNSDTKTGELCKLLTTYPLPKFSGI